MMATRSAATRILLVDDDAQVRSSVPPLLLAIDESYRVVTSLPSADNLADAVIRHQPDIVLLDIDMPGRSPFHAIEDIRYRGGPTRVVVFSALGDAPTVRACLAAGAAGYILKMDAPEALQEGIETVLAGRRYLSPGVASVA